MEQELIISSNVNSDEEVKVIEEIKPIKKVRMVEQDIAKGLCMLAVLFVHCVPGTDIMDLILRAVIGFCMPVFFILSGFNHKPGYRPYGQQVARRTKQLLLPLLVYSLFFLVAVGGGLLILKKFEESLGMVKAFAGLWIGDPFASLLSLPSIATFTGTQRAFEPYWFLIYLFGASLIYFGAVRLANKSFRWMIGTIVGLIIISMIFQCIQETCAPMVFKNATAEAMPVLFPLGSNIAPALAALMIIGFGFNKYKILERGLAKSWKNPFLYITVIITICCGLFLRKAGQITGSGEMTRAFKSLQCLTFEPISMNSHLATLEIPYTIIYGAIATYSIVMVCGLIRKIKYVSKFLNFFGQNSMNIFMIHLIFVALGQLIVLQKIELKTIIIPASEFDWRFILAWVVAVILVSIYVLVFNKIRSSNKRRREEKKKQLLIKEHQRLDL